MSALPSDRAFVPSGSSPQAVSPVPASIPSAGQRIAALAAETLVKTGRPALEIAIVRTPITVESGPWSGHVVRRARKLFKCADRCGHYIAGGELYLQGDTNPYEAGGFAHDRLCLKCAGPMVLHAVAQAIEARSGETREAGLDPKDESAVGNADAPGD